MPFYEGYEEWKGWDSRFQPSADDAAYFAGETRGIAICGADLLEIGFGAGHFLSWARTQGARVHGTEISDELRAGALAEGIAILPTRLADAAATHEARFDTIAAFDVFEHMELDEIVANLAAIERMLRPGGHLLMRFPNAQSPFGLSQQYGDATHRSCLSRGIFEQLIRGSRLAVVRYDSAYRISTGGPATRVVRIFRNTMRGMIGWALNQIYGTAIPWDPGVTLVLRRQEETDPANGLD